MADALSPVGGITGSLRLTSMIGSLWRHECEVALGAVRDGAMLARQIRQRIGTETFQKSDRSPVTVADFAVQALVASRLPRAFPRDPIVAEEDSASLCEPGAQHLGQSVRCALESVMVIHSSEEMLAAINCEWRRARQPILDP